MQNKRQYAQTYNRNRSVAGIWNFWHESIGRISAEGNEKSKDADLMQASGETGVSEKIVTANTPVPFSANGLIDYLEQQNSEELEIGVYKSKDI